MLFVRALISKTNNKTWRKNFIGLLFLENNSNFKISVIESDSNEIKINIVKRAAKIICNILQLNSSLNPCRMQRELSYENYVNREVINKKYNSKNNKYVISLAERLGFGGV